MTDIISILNDLPLNAIKLIGSFIDMKDFWSFCLTCKSFSRVCFDAEYVDWKLGLFLRKLVPLKILENGKLVDAYRKFKDFQPSGKRECFKYDLLGNQLFLSPCNSGWDLTYIMLHENKFRMMVGKNYLYFGVSIGKYIAKLDNLYKLCNKPFQLPKMNEFKYLSSFFERLWEEIENHGPKWLKDKYKDIFRILVQGSLEKSRINCP